MVMKYDELSRDEGSKNSSCLRIRLHRTDECQNCLGNYLKRKEMGEIHDTLVQETFFLKRNVFIFILSELAYKYCKLFAKV
jgi:hypothetical protein